MDKGAYTRNMLPGISVYSSLKQDPVIVRIERLFRELSCECADFYRASACYSEICNLLYESDANGRLPDYLFDKILCDENIFTKRCAKNEYIKIPLMVKKAVEYDLNTLYLISTITSKEIKEAMCAVFPEKKDVISLLAVYSNEHRRFQVSGQWGADLISIGDFHRHNGVSVFTKYYAFCLDSRRNIVPIKRFDPLSLDHLKKYEIQKRRLVENTLGFLKRKPANNVLLYGDRGTGKSSCVKAVLNEYYNKGLRMIQIAKEDIVYIHHVLTEIEDIPLRFIIFIDDLSFNESDEGFNALKAVLEGSLNEIPPNVLIYATSNRRHLIKETFSSREGDELHASDTRDETASLADRFGLTITFLKPNLPDYLDIVCEIAKERKVAVSEDVLRRGANTFASQKGNRSGRVARQYIDYVEGRLGLNLPIE